MANTKREKKTVPPDCVMTQIIFTFRHHRQNSKIARLNYMRSCVPFVKVRTPDLSMLWPVQSNSHFSIFWTCRVMHGVLHERCDAPRLNTRQKKSRAAKNRCCRTITAPCHGSANDDCRPPALHWANSGLYFCHFRTAETICSCSTKFFSVVFASHHFGHLVHKLMNFLKYVAHHAAVA